jgi:hypothetical protein
VPAPTRGCSRGARPDRRPSRGVVDSYGHSGATPIKLRPDALLSWTLARNCETRAKDGPISHEAPASRDAKSSRITQAPPGPRVRGTFSRTEACAPASTPVVVLVHWRSSVRHAENPSALRPRGSDGGGGGNRTRVRKPYVPGPTCLAVFLILVGHYPSGREDDRPAQERFSEPALSTLDTRACERVPRVWMHRHMPVGG